MAYFLCALLSDHLEQGTNILSYFWLPSGLYLGGLLLNRPARWPMLMVTAGLGDLVYNVISADSWPVPIWFLGHLGNTAGAALGASLVRTFVSKRPSLLNFKELLGVVVLGGMVGTSLSAFIGAAIMRLQDGTSPYWGSFTSWYASDLLGVILFTPAVIVWHPAIMRRAPLPRGMWGVEFSLLNLSLFSAIGLALYFHWLHQADPLFVSFPFVIWAAVRFGLPGATLAILVSTVTSNWFGALGYGTVSLVQLSHARRIIEGLVSQGVFAFVGLMPATVFTTLRKTRARDAIRTRTMTLLANGAKLQEVLDSIVLGVQAEDQDMICSILLLDQSGKRLVLGSAPTLPPFYSAGVHGMELGPDVGCCGAAAFLNRRIIAEDIRTDPRWVGFRELAERAVLRSCWSQPIHDSSGRVLGSFAVYHRQPLLPTSHDIELISAACDVAAVAAERKVLEERYLRGQRLESIGTLAGGIAHDLNNVLTPILMCAEILKNDEMAQSELELIDSIHVSAKRATDLVRQVLTFARGVEGARVALSVGLVVKEIESIVARTFPKNIAFHQEVAHELPLVLGDRTQLEQVLLNLCVNARDAMKDGGIIRIAAKELTLGAKAALAYPEFEPGRFVELVVEDTGVGMSPEVVDRIFEPFFTTKEIGHGTGLGLSTVLGIVRSHGGHIDVSSHLGLGSCFRILLPVDPAGSKVGSDHPEVETVRHGRNETILLVDDEVEVLRAAARTLAAFGYDVIPAENGKMALEAYKRHRPRIAAVVTDLMMPVMDGHDLIAGVRKLNPDLPVITVSGLKVSSEPPVPGSWKHLPKPFTSEQLVAAIGCVLDEAAQGRSTQASS
jgi:signal transduction histidine kinase/integral membrane sensor domain MASE1/ActR/RegA family two-component response regulator